mgnify:CR=1 FL=1
MPVQKFKTFEEAREALWSDTIDAAYLKRVAELWACSDRLYPKRFRPGVYKYKTLEEADEARDSLLV